MKASKISFGGKVRYSTGTFAIKYTAMRYWLFLTLLIFTLTVMAQKRDRKLEAALAALLQPHKGVAGIYVMNLKNGNTAAYNADTLFPTASMVKVPILVGVMQKIKEGSLKYTDELVYKDSLLYEGVDILGSFKNEEKIELGKVMMLMLTMSDNTASLWLQSLAGTGTRINELMQGLGLQHTRVNSRTPGREEARKTYGWGQTTPKEMATLFQLLWQGKVIDDSSSKRMLRLLSRNFWDDVAISAIPATVFVASKNGAVDGSRSEVLLVNGKTPYIFCICTKNNIDTSWTDNNEAWQMTKKVSQLLWQHFN